MTFMAGGKVFRFVSLGADRIELPLRKQPLPKMACRGWFQLGFLQVWSKWARKGSFALSSMRCTFLLLPLGPRRSEGMEKMENSEELALFMRRADLSCRTSTAHV